MDHKKIMIFAWDHLNNGKGRCVEDEENICLYISEDGEHKCPIGAMLPKNHPVFSSKFIGNVDSLLKEYPKESFPLYFHAEKHILAKIQKVHDIGKNWDGNKLNDNGINAFKRACNLVEVNFEEVCATQSSGV